MDTTDPNITFDKNGICNHCSNAVERLSQIPNNIDEKSKFLKNCVKKIKLSRKHSSYDCIIGLSGGLDSSYLAFKIKKMCHFWYLRSFFIKEEVYNI